MNSTSIINPDAYIVSRRGWSRSSYEPVSVVSESKSTIMVKTVNGAGYIFNKNKDCNKGYFDPRVEKSQWGLYEKGASKRGFNNGPLLRFDIENILVAIEDNKKLERAEVLSRTLKELEEANTSLAWRGCVLDNDPIKVSLNNLIEMVKKELSN